MYEEQMNDMSWFTLNLGSISVQLEFKSKSELEIEMWMARVQEEIHSEEERQMVVWSMVGYGQVPTFPLAYHFHAVNQLSLSASAILCLKTTIAHESRFNLHVRQTRSTKELAAWGAALKQCQWEADG